MTKKMVEGISTRVIVWCIDTYGFSKFRDGGPLLEVQYVSDVSKKTYGEFDQDEVMIYVYTRTNRTLRCLVNTVIHEFIHYTQNPSWSSRYAGKYGDGLRNPYEKEAEMVAIRDTDRCIKELGL